MRANQFADLCTATSFDVILCHKRMPYLYHQQTDFAFPVILSSIFFFSAATRSRKPMDFDPVRDASWREVNEESGRFLERVPVSPARFACRLETYWLRIGRLCRLPKGLCLFARIRSSYDSHDRSISLKNKETFKLFHQLCT